MFIDTSSVACDSNVTSCAAVAESLLLIDCRPGVADGGYNVNGAKPKQSRSGNDQEGTP